MGSTVFANKQGISHKGSGTETNSTAPDVCKTPVGSAMVPIPYANNAKSSTLEKGSKTVKIGGNSVAIAGCCYSSSTGDQAGSGKGILSGTVGGKAEFANYSFDVKIEGKGVCRNDDLTTHNNKNTIGKNRDSSADPPESKIPPPPSDTLRIKVVEHLSWDSFDKKAGKFYLGHKDNKPIKNREFKVKLPSGIEKKTTNGEGIIEVSNLNPHEEYGIILETKDSKLNKKYFLFFNTLTPFEKDQIEQDKPKGKALIHSKDGLMTGINYMASLYQPCVIVDSHMHIQSNRCAPMPFIWSSIPLVSVILTRLQVKRVAVESAGEIFGRFADFFIYKIIYAKDAINSAKNAASSEIRGMFGMEQIEVPLDAKQVYDGLCIRKLVEISKNPTEMVADQYMKRRRTVYNDVFLTNDMYKDVPQLLFFSVVMTMDMEFAHIDGYYGVKVYNAIYDINDPEKTPIAYWTPLHGRWIKGKRNDKVYTSKGEYSNPLERKEIDNQSEDEFNRSAGNFKKEGIPGIYHDEYNRPIKINIRATPLLITEKETGTEDKKQGEKGNLPGAEKNGEEKHPLLLYEQWKDQVFKTELSTVKNPLKLLPMYHYDPRRWQIEKTRNDHPFNQVGASGIYLGFKLYTSQGFRPGDFRRLPVLKEFYARCCNRGIPVMNHCTPEGAPTFDRSEYIKFRHEMDTAADDREREEHGGALSGGKDYFNEQFVSPKAWVKVLAGKHGGTRFNRLRLCLAHFGGGTKLGIKWIDGIINLMKKYPHVYTDISSSMTNSDFKKHFKDKICADKDFKRIIRRRIMFGTDWYLTLSGLTDGIDYQDYCKQTKKFLDEIDSSLWVRFTQANPYKFYRIDEQIKRIAGNLIDMRQKDKKILEILEKPLAPDKVAEIYKEAAYIEAANRPFVLHEEYQK